MKDDSNIVQEMKEHHEAAWGKTTPNVGYPRAFSEMTERGRQQISEAAGKKGLRNFPPAREIVK